MRVKSVAPVLPPQRVMNALPQMQDGERVREPVFKVRKKAEGKHAA